MRSSDLYAPIRKREPKPIDFQVWRNFDATYDWKPISPRAHTWTKKHFSDLHQIAHKMEGGWMRNFSGHPDCGPDADRHGFLKEMKDADFQFEVVK